MRFHAYNILSNAFKICQRINGHVLPKLQYFISFVTLYMTYCFAKMFVFANVSRRSNNFFPNFSICLLHFIICDLNNVQMCDCASLKIEN